MSKRKVYFKPTDNVKPNLEEKEIPIEGSPEKVLGDVSVNWFDKTRLWIYNTFSLKLGGIGMWNTIKDQIVGMILRWILKIGGTFFATIGIENGTIEQTIGGIIAILAGFIISLFQGKKAAEATPPSG